MLRTLPQIGSMWRTLVAFVTCGFAVAGQLSCPSMSEFLTQHDDFSEFGQVWAQAGHSVLQDLGANASLAILGACMGNVWVSVQYPMRLCKYSI